MCDNMLVDVMEIVLWSRFMDLKDRIMYSMTSMSAAKRLVSMEALSEGISHSPVPSSCRFNFWRWCLQRHFDPSIFEPLHGGDPVGYYMHHRDLLMPTASRKSTGQLGEIMRDVGRTCPEHPFFDSKKGRPGETLLARILCATLSSTPSIGYCQGMNFVVATLLLTRIPPDILEQESDFNVDAESTDLSPFNEIESDVFWLFQYILIKNDQGMEMEFIWKPGFPKMKLRVYQFDRLLETYLPALHSHFEEVNLSPEVVVSQWFMTLFSNTLPLPLTLHMWDYIFVGFWPAIYRATLSILYVLQDKLMNMDLEGVGILVRDWKRGKFDIPISFQELLCIAETFPIKQDTLLLIQENYALEMIAAALGDQLDLNSSVGKSYHGGCMGLPKPGAQSWLCRYGEFPEDMRDVMFDIHNEVNEMSAQVDRDKAVLQKKILKACEQCEQAYEELDKAIGVEMKWLHQTSNLKHDLSNWERKAKVALSDLKWETENEKRLARSSSSYQEEDESDSDSESDCDDYSGSESSSGEYVDDEWTSSSDECSDSCSDYDSIDQEENFEHDQSGGSYLLEAVSNVTNLLLPSSTPTTDPDDTTHQAANLNGNGISVTQEPPPTPDSEKVLTAKSSLTQLPVSNEAAAVAEKIKSHPGRRRTSSRSVGAKPLASASRDSEDCRFQTELDSGGENNGLSGSPPLNLSKVRTGEDDCTVDDMAGAVKPIYTGCVTTTETSSSFHKLKSTVMGRSKPKSNEKSQAPNKGGGRIGFSRRYIASKLERRKVKIEKAKECNFLHKQIIKSSKEIEYAKKKLAEARENKQAALLADEEAKEWKESLCSQYQNLVKDADRCRSQKLIYIVDTYGM